MGYSCLLATLGALVGALLAVLWGLGLVGRSRPAEKPAPPPPSIGHGAPEQTQWVERMVFSPTPDRPESTPDIISAESPVIYCFYEHSRLPPDVALKAGWWHEGKQLGELPLRDHQRGAQPAAAVPAPAPPGSAQPAPAPPPPPRPPATPTHAVGRFSIFPPATDNRTPSSFAPGVYEVELSVAGQEEIAWRASFMVLPRAAKILEGGGPPEAPLLITDLQVAPEAGEDARPINPTTSFPADIKRIYACFRYQGMTPGGSVTVRWHFGYLEVPQLRHELTISTSQGWASAWMERTGSDPFPPGQYRVTVHLGADDRPLAGMSFTISPARGPASGPPGSGR